MNISQTCLYIRRSVQSDFKVAYVIRQFHISHMMTLQKRSQDGYAEAYTWFNFVANFVWTYSVLQCWSCWLSKYAIFALMHCILHGQCSVCNWIHQTICTYHLTECSFVQGMDVFFASLWSCSAPCFWRALLCFQKRTIKCTRLHIIMSQLNLSLAIPCSHDDIIIKYRFQNVFGPLSLCLRGMR